MAEENKEKKCNCSLLLGIALVAVGVITGMMGGFVFQLPQILSIVVGVGLILLRFKGSWHCKCCK